MMETTTSFYATLPSNACLDFYPKNKQSSFKIELPQTVYLSKPYEVALAEIQYPVSWKTFGHPKNYTILIQHHDDEGRLDYRQQIFIPSTYYQSIGELLRALNKNLKTYFEIKGTNHRVEFVENSLEQKVSLKAPADILLFLQEECAEVLGFERDQWIKGGTYAPYQHNLSRGFHSLFVYCSICEEQIVGNHSVQLLRTVALNGKRGDHVIKTYGEPHYVPVNTSQFTTIEIDIKDDTDQLVPFVSGKVVCKLHFRQQRKQ